PHGGRGEPTSFEIISQSVEEPPGVGDRARCHSIDTGRACPLVAPDPVQRHNEERRVADEVVEVIETAASIAGRPLVQLALHLEYPPAGLIEVGPRIADVHRRSPLSARSLRTCWTPSPCSRL